MTRLTTMTLATGIAGASIFATACILHDGGADNIGIQTDGYEWCAFAAGAEAWHDNGQPEAIRDASDLSPRGCICASSDNNDMLSQWETLGDHPAPSHSDYDGFEEINGEIVTETETNCISQANSDGYDNNDCVAAVPAYPTLQRIGGLGECTYYREQKLATGGPVTGGAPPPDDGGGGGGSAGGSSGGQAEAPPAPFDLTSLSCADNVCELSKTLRDDLVRRAVDIYHFDSTRAVLTTNGLVLETVGPNDIAAIAGHESGQSLVAINGLPAFTLAQIVASASDLRYAQTFTYTMKSSSGETSIHRVVVN